METLSLLVVLMLLGLVLVIAKMRYVDRGMDVCVVVLGDIGRSPRMQYHSLSLASHGLNVHLIGYGGSVPHAGIRSNPNIHLHFMKETPHLIQKLPRLLIYIVKVLWQVIILSVALLRCAPFHTILLQNPPCLPSLAVCWFLSRLCGCQLVVDWHNYGYTILGLALHPTRPLVRFAKWYEHFFGRLSDANICVTKAMKQDLHENWGIRAETMYDRPPEIFRETPLEEQHALFMKLSKEYQVFKSSDHIDENEEVTAFTRKLPDGTVSKLAQRPALLISSTSWTEDEDFSILLNALEDYEEEKSKGCDLPDLVCAITGKGPLKEYYIGQLKEKSWKHVHVCTPWLEAEDYPRLLGCADLGVCLHMSSSGLDLPMKVVDMFGCGLPVCAIHFKCLDELVKHEENGKVFHTEMELSKQLQELLGRFPKSRSKLDLFRANLKSFQNTRWTETWDTNVKPLFKS